MKRIFLTTIGISMLLAGIKAQVAENDSAQYKNRKLTLNEINLVSSYYEQNGDHAAVTGGIGSEKLNDIANIIEVNFIRYDRHLRKQSLDVEAGIDYYTSASSDLIDLKANSSASHSDARIYPSVTFTSENTVKGKTFAAGISTSSESDYESVGGNVSFSKKTKDASGEFTVKLQTYLDAVSIIKPIELRTSNPRDYYHYPTKPRDTYEVSLSYSQIINDRLQVMFLADVVRQNGYLSLPFHRVYFKDSTVHMEHLPNSRLKFPLGFRTSYFLGDKVIIRSYYRFYVDSWGLAAHTANIEVPVKLSPFVSISPFYRWYSQSGIRYFAPYKVHTNTEAYYTSNYDYSKFISNFFGAGIRLQPLKGLLGNKRFTLLEIRYGHYQKNVHLNSDIISMNLQFK